MLGGPGDGAISLLGKLFSILPSSKLEAASVPHLLESFIPSTGTEMDLDPKLSSAMNSLEVRAQESSSGMMCIEGGVSDAESEVESELSDTQVEDCPPIALWTDGVVTKELVHADEEIGDRERALGLLPRLQREKPVCFCNSILLNFKLCFVTSFFLP